MNERCSVDRKLLIETMIEEIEVVLTRIVSVYQSIHRNFHLLTISAF